MKLTLIFLLIFLSTPSIAQNKNPWLSEVYGHDNKYAALKGVKIYKENDGYKIFIKNQFKFKCDISFSSTSNTPSELKNCISQIPPKPRKGRVSCERAGLHNIEQCQKECKHCFEHWTVVGGNINLKCTKTKSEEICRGSYKLTSIPTGSGDHTTLTIARRLN